MSTQPKSEFAFSPAVREEISFHATLSGVSGSGKTTQALLLAYGLCGDWKKIALADTENRRALYTVGQRYGDTEIGQFMHCPVSPPYSPQRMARLVREVEESGLYSVLIIDSLSKEWEGQGGTLEQVERTSGANKYTAWKEPGDAHRRFIDAVQFASIHVIATMRSKTKYDIVEEVNAQGKTVSKPVKRGLEPIARAGTEYEFDVAWHVEKEDHRAWVDKDNTSLFDAELPAPLDASHGRRIAEWLSGAASQIGSAQWVERRGRQIQDFSGSLDGLKTLWRQTHAVRARVAPEDFARLEALKDAAKARLPVEAV